MIRALQLAIVFVVACGGTTDTVPPSLETPEALDLDSASVAGVSTTGVLGAGKSYQVRISGTLSLWPSKTWSSACAGTPDSAPLFPSSGVTGPVSVDAEWMWSWPTASKSHCPNGVPNVAAPRAERRVLVGIVASDKPSVLPSPVETSIAADHSYTYAIKGAGERAVFVVDDPTPEDNYGHLRITITPE